MTESYDDHQVHAPLVTCPRCGVRVYATNGHAAGWLCIRCTHEVHGATAFSQIKERNRA